MTAGLPAGRCIRPDHDPALIQDDGGQFPSPMSSPEPDRVSAISHAVWCCLWLRPRKEGGYQ